VLKDAKLDGKEINKKRKKGGRKKEIFKEQSKELQRSNFKFLL
jgi:hypothetical protein